MNHNFTQIADIKIFKARVIPAAVRMVLARGWKQDKGGGVAKKFKMTKIPPATNRFVNNTPMGMKAFLKEALYTVHACKLSSFIRGQW